MQRIHLNPDWCVWGESSCLPHSQKAISEFQYPSLLPSTKWPIKFYLVKMISTCISESGEQGWRRDESTRQLLKDNTGKLTAKEVKGNT